ncbi:unnamed protein product [Symbiodinium natans]|uniref:Uncharacterized protein n=1 Tax=Symbiodinium natans TaxID=878477 RepID=A0A812TLC5_9DINO|nr:unnamed protein product [Symbiodinium natans]
MDCKQRYFLRCASVEEAPPVPDSDTAITDPGPCQGDLDLEAPKRNVGKRALQRNVCRKVRKWIWQVDLDEIETCATPARASQGLQVFHAIIVCVTELPDTAHVC